MFGLYSSYAKQAAFSAHPARADELREIGPPSSGDGWAARVWPRLRRLAGICSGSFGTCLSKVGGLLHTHVRALTLNQLRTILGPRIAIRNHGYGASEAHMSVFFDPNDSETFVFDTEEVIEFVDAESEAICSNVLQGVSILGSLQPRSDPLTRVLSVGVGTGETISNRAYYAEWTLAISLG